jgi:phage gp46-like protein
MADVSFIRRTTDTPHCDLAIVDGDIAFGDELESMTLVSLLTNARATPDEYKNASLTLFTDIHDVVKLQGWWGDSYSSVQGNQIGSKLWLLARQKATNNIRILTEEYVKSALQYLIDDGIVATIEPTAVWKDDQVEMSIQLTKPDGTTEEFRFQFVWGV